MSFLVSRDGPALGSAAQIELDNQAAVSGSKLGAGNLPSAKVPREIYVTIAGLGATSTSQTAFIADDAYQVIGVQSQFGTASTSGTLNVEVAADGTAVGSGTAVLSATIALSGTANTKASGTLATNVDSLQVAQGNHINILLAGTLTGLANACVTIALKRV